MSTSHPSIKTYVTVFAILMALLVVTVAAAFVHLGPLNVVIALTIALVKAAVVVLFFMHVRYSSRLTQVFVLAAFLWLGILFVLTFSDYLTRGWLPTERGWTETPVIPKPG